jgi:hypothetical protein
MHNYGFVYIWRDKQYKRFYIGSHWGTIDDGYICSSNSMRDAYRRRPQDFKRRIIEKVYTNRKELLEKEAIWLSKIDDSELRNKYYNKCRVTNYLDQNGAHNPFYGKKHSEETKLKMREAAKNRLPNRKGKKATPETLEKMRLARLGSKHTEEAKRKISLSNIGKHKESPSEETKKKISESLKGNIPWNKGLTKNAHI